MTKQLTIGYVGLGEAGWPMCGRLVDAGYQVIVRDSDQQRTRQFAAEYGCASAVQLDDLAEAEIVVTMLPNGNVVRHVLLDEDGGLSTRLRPGTIVIDSSSSDPRGTRELGSALAGGELVLLDAPVTRSVPGANHLTIMVGGDDQEALARALPVLEAMAKRVFRAGRLGCGHAMKTLNNLLGAAGFVAALDAVVIGYRYGLDPQAMMEVFNAGTAHNFSTEHVVPTESLTRRYDSGFKLALMIKDMGICRDLAESVGFGGELPAYLHQQLSEALAALGDEQLDHAAAIEHWEHKAGVELPSAAGAASRP
ncbi:MAG: NAD(P)-dependent oxidoreductase [Solirubrobacteraceae bacterium]